MRTPIPSRLVLLLAAAAMLAALSPAPAKADADANFQHQQSFQKIYADNSLNELQPLDADHPSRPLSDVLSLADSSGQLVLHTNLPSTMGQAQKLKLDSDDEWSIVNIDNGAIGSGPVIPTKFSLSRNKFDPKRTDMLTVQQINDVFIITNEIRTPAGRKSVQLQMQRLEPSQNNPGFCQLMIQEATLDQPGAPVIWHSADFAGFMREHPVAADRYIRPLLHQLRQDAAMAPDPMLTFEVFSDQWAPDAATTAKITGLVDDLAARDFHTRTHAEHELANLGKAAAIVLLHLDRTKLTAEQTTRLDKLLSPYQPVPLKNAATLGADPAFLLTCLYSDDPIVRKAALANLETATKLKLNFDPTADDATRVAAIPAMLKQLIDAKVIAAAP
jgi:hypothetical protein